MLAKASNVTYQHRTYSLHSIYVKIMTKLNRFEIESQAPKMPRLSYHFHYGVGFRTIFSFTQQLYFDCFARSL